MLKTLIDKQTSPMSSMRLRPMAALIPCESLSLPILLLFQSTNTHYALICYGLDCPAMIKGQIDHISRGSWSNRIETGVHRQWGITRAVMGTHRGWEVQGGPHLEEPKRLPAGSDDHPGGPRMTTSLLGQKLQNAH